MCSIELFIRSLPYLDKKWLKADLNSALRSTEDLAILWNNLIQDNELSLINAPGILNTTGNYSFIGEDGKHYCGIQKLTCTCCVGYCSPNVGCNCQACQRLDAEEACLRKGLNNNQHHIQIYPSSETVLDSWLWGPIPSKNL